MISEVLAQENSVRSVLAILERLIAFDTTSSKSNRALIDYVHGYLADLGVASDVIVSPDGSKANLLASIGPVRPGGIVLSGHTDVVPVTGQAWSTNPFQLVAKGSRLYGRGTADMKSFIACAMAAVPSFCDEAYSGPPIHLAFSYDEEVGCHGAPAIIEEILRSNRAPSAVIVGEPTSMKTVGTHKGTTAFDVAIVGHEAHSSLTHLGASANHVAIRLMSKLLEIADALTRDALQNEDFMPAWSTLTIGTLQGGTALNILSKRCEFGFDLRYLPTADPEKILAPFMEDVRRLDADIRSRFPGTGITVTRRMDVPPLVMDATGDAGTLLCNLIGDNGPQRAVPFGSEAGQYQQARMSSIICGPGSIDQAHQPDEFIERQQIEECMLFMSRLRHHLGSL